MNVWPAGAEPDSDDEDGELPDFIAEQIGHHGWNVNNVMNLFDGLDLADYEFDIDPDDFFDDDDEDWYDEYYDSDFEFRSDDEDEEAHRKLVETERMLDITNLHYRKYYDDELENNKELFPKEPFLNVPIKRGQSRGLKKSWFNFGGDKTDESGSVSNEKIVGSFKGRIRVYNDTEEKEYRAEKREKMEKIMDLIKTIHFKTFKQPFELTLDEILESGAEET